jgi:hypothetical protein
MEGKKDSKTESERVRVKRRKEKKHCTIHGIPEPRHQGRQKDDAYTQQK